MNSDKRNASNDTSSKSGSRPPSRPSSASKSKRDSGSTSSGKFKEEVETEVRGSFISFKQAADQEKALRRESKRLRNGRIGLGRSRLTDTKSQCFNRPRISLKGEEKSHTRERMRHPNKIQTEMARPNSSRSRGKVHVYRDEVKIEESCRGPEGDLFKPLRRSITYVLDETVNPKETLERLALVSYENSRAVMIKDEETPRATKPFFLNIDAQDRCNTMKPVSPLHKLFHSSSRKICKPKSIIIRQEEEFESSREDDKKNMAFWVDFNEIPDPSGKAMSHLADGSCELGQAHLNEMLQSLVTLRRETVCGRFPIVAGNDEDPHSEEVLQFINDQLNQCVQLLKCRKSPHRRKHRTDMP